MRVKTFDRETTFCIVKARLELRETPEKIIHDIGCCERVDASLLKSILARPGDYQGPGNQVTCSGNSEGRDQCPG